MKILIQVFVIVLAGLLGFVLGQVFNDEAPAAVATPLAAAASPRQIAGSGESAQVAGLRQRIAALEAELAKRSVAVPAAESAAAGERSEPPRGPERWREEMERLKREEPEKFAALTNRMESFRRNRQADVQARYDYVASADTSRMSAAERENHERLLELMARREELMAQLGDENLSDAERGEIMRSLHEMGRELRSANTAERETLLNQAAADFGFSGEAAASVVETIKDVIDATEAGHGMGPPPPPGGPGMGGPGPGAPGGAR